MIGSPGAGKSTFARALAEATRLPLVHLDAHYHLPGWTEPDPEVWDEKLGQLIGAESWIIDGNYGSSLPLRLTRADTVVLLDYSTPLCLWRLARRLVRWRGQVRPDAPPGCFEKLDWEFVHYIFAFRRTKLPKVETDLDQFHGQVLRFARPRAAQAFLDSLS